jgi:hypothetical protein
MEFLSLSVLLGFVILFLVSQLRMKKFVKHWALKHDYHVEKVRVPMSYIGTPFYAEASTINAVRKVWLRNPQGERRCCWLKMRNVFESIDEAVAHDRFDQVWCD